MSKSYTSLKAILITKFQALDGSDETKLFDAVYGVRETKPEGYPSCYVIEKTGGGEILDTHRNEREWQFDVIIYQEIGKKTPEQAYAVLLDATDRLIELLDQDPMLLDAQGEAQCKWVKVVPMEFEFGNQDTAFHQTVLTVAIVDLVNRFPDA